MLYTHSPIKILINILFLQHERLSSVCLYDCLFVGGQIWIRYIVCIALSFATHRPPPVSKGKDTWSIMAVYVESKSVKAWTTIYCLYVGVGEGDGGRGGGGVSPLMMALLLTLL